MAEFIRGPRRTDQGYISSTWVRSLTGIADRRPNALAKAASHLVDEVLDRDDTRALVRHAPGDMDQIRAWIVYCEAPGVPLTHYVYCRKEYRERGYATSLLQAAGVTKNRAMVYTTMGPPGPGRKLITAYPLGAYMPLEEFLAEPGKVKT